MTPYVICSIWFDITFAILNFDVLMNIVFPYAGLATMKNNIEKYMLY